MIDKTFLSKRWRILLIWCNVEDKDNVSDLSCSSNEREESKVGLRSLQESAASIVDPKKVMIGFGR